ncbi:Septal ring factor [Nitrincola nitratireducens]|uniref:Septal ring factor n=2 Tax=Oceanospirillaceae TaxID=135620 RepID=W9V2T0_9GAMM|nr:Septal ring factor [Nitrincola nitratireducens]
MAQDPQATAAQIERLKREIHQLQSSISQRSTRQRSEQQALANAEREIGRVAADIRKTDQELAELNQNMAGLQSQRQSLERQLTERRELIQTLLREQYRQGRQPKFQLLLQQQNPDQLERMLKYFDRVNRELSEQLRVYQDQLNRLTDTRQSIGATEASILERRERLQAEQSRLSAARAEREKQIKELAEQQQREQRQLAQKQQDQEQLQQVLAQIQRSLELSNLTRDNQTFASLRGKLPWPIQGAVSRRFGAQHSGVAFEGLLVRASQGADVKAVHHGRVVFSDWLRGYGLVLILDHGSGYMSLYGHNQTLLKEPGDWVSAGQVVATAGNSGGHEEVGLYFAIRHNGRPVDPSVWLTKP